MAKGNRGRRPPKGKPKAGANATGAKRPATGTSTNLDKTPRLHERPHEEATVVWRFARMDLDGPWGWKRLDLNDADTVHAKCANWEKMRTGEMFGRGGNKRIPLADLSPAAQARLREIDADDLDALWELRLGGRLRIWGTRSEHVFDLIWWDPGHTVCPSTKKNT